MNITLQHKKLIKEYIKYIRLTKLSEARDDSFAEYEVKKDKVIATLKKQKATAFTKLAEECIINNWQVISLNTKSLVF